MWHVSKVNILPKVIIIPEDGDKHIIATNEHHGYSWLLTGLGFDFEKELIKLLKKYDIQPENYGFLPPKSPEFNPDNILFNENQSNLSKFLQS